MNKKEFLDSLRRSLKALPRQDIDRIVDYYNEIIDDKIEAGEEEATVVFSIGSVEEIAQQAIEEKNVSQIGKKRKMSKQQWVVLIAGSPLWVPLLLAAVAVIFSFYLCAWSVVASLGVTELALLVAGPAGTVCAFIAMFANGVPLGFFVLGTSVFVSGIALLLVFPTVKLFKLSISSTKVSVLKLVRLSIGGGQK